MLFPEGGFLYKRRVPSQTYAQKHGYPHLEHVTLPRTGAFQSVLQAIGPREPGGEAEAYLDSEGNLADLSATESDYENDENGGSDAKSEKRSRTTSNEGLSPVECCACIRKDCPCRYHAPAHHTHTVQWRNDHDEAAIGVEARQGHSGRNSREEIHQRCIFVFLCR